MFVMGQNGGQLRVNLLNLIATAVVRSSYIWLVVYFVMLFGCNRNSSHIPLAVFFGWMAIGRILMIVSAVTVVCSPSLNSSTSPVLLVYQIGSSVLLAALCLLAMVFSVLRRKYNLPAFLLCAVMGLLSVLSVIFFYTPGSFCSKFIFSVVSAVLLIFVWIIVAISLGQHRVCPHNRRSCGQHSNCSGRP